MQEFYQLPNGQEVFEDFTQMQARAISSYDYPILKHLAGVKFFRAKHGNGPAGGTDRSFYEVADLLPRLNGQKFEVWVEEELEKRRIEAKETGYFRKLRIVDVGFGAGGFLLGCRERWNSKEIELIGYGDKYIDPSVDEINLLEEREIKIIDGNICNIKDELGENSVDAVVSSFVLMHVEYPVFEIIKDIYSILRNKGHAYIYTGGLYLVDEGTDSIIKTENISEFELYRLEDYTQDKISSYINKHGIPFYLRGVNIGFEKTNIDINNIGIENLFLFPDRDCINGSVLRFKEEIK